MEKKGIEENNVNTSYTLNLGLFTIILFTMGQWPSGHGAGFPIQGSRVQNHWVAPRLTQLFIFPRSAKWVPQISGNLVVKRKLPPQSGSSLVAVEPYP